MPQTQAARDCKPLTFVTLPRGFVDRLQRHFLSMEEPQSTSLDPTYGIADHHRVPGNPVSSGPPEVQVTPSVVPSVQGV